MKQESEILHKKGSGADTVLPVILDLDKAQNDE